MKVLVTSLAVLMGGVLAGPVGDQELKFQAGVARVTLAVVVRDSKGRPIRGLSQQDFDVRDQGISRPITDFRSDAGAVSIAILLDTSGSMRVGPKIERLNEFAALLLATMQEGKDEAALFAFERTVHVVHDFTNSFGLLRTSLESIEPFGSTALYDAIAETAERVAKRPGRHAVVVLTDAVDTSSSLTDQAVSAIASAIDVPVYGVAVGLPIDLSERRDAEAAVASVEQLSRQTGGSFYRSTNLAEASSASRDIITDLRHQYLIGLEPSEVPGWHRLEVRVRQRGTIQARSGYWVGEAAIR